MKAGPPEIIFGGYVHIFNFTLLGAIHELPEEYSNKKAITSGCGVIAFLLYRNLRNIIARNIYQHRIQSGREMGEAARFFLFIQKILQIRGKSGMIIMLNKSQ